MPLPQLRRVRWAVRAALTLGVAASVAANILHARPNPVSQVIAAWPPLALLLTVELISRVPVHRRSLAAVRLGATSLIAGIAAWVSYWHMAGVAARYGETGPSPYLLPLSVDGLIVVASISLVELAGRIRAVETAAPAKAEPAAPETAAPAKAEPAAPETAAPAKAEPAAPETAARAKAEPAAPETAAPAKAEPARTRAKSAPTKAKTTAAKAAPRKRAVAKATPAKATPAKAIPVQTTPVDAAPAERIPAGAAWELSPAEMAALAAQLKAEQPDLTQAAIAAQLGITTHRLRQLSRI